MQEEDALMCYIGAFVVGGRYVYGLMLGVIKTPCSSCWVPVWRIMDAGCFTVPEGFIVWKYAHGLCFLLPSVPSLPFQRLLTPEMVGKHSLPRLFLHPSFSSGKGDSA